MSFAQTRIIIIFNLPIKNAEAFIFFLIVHGKEILVTFHYSLLLISSSYIQKPYQKVRLRQLIQPSAFKTELFFFFSNDPFHSPSQIQTPSGYTNLLDIKPYMFRKPGQKQLTFWSTSRSTALKWKPEVVVHRSCAGF